MTQTIAASKEKRRTKHKLKGVLALFYIFFGITICALAFYYRKILANLHDQFEWQSQLEVELDSASRLRPRSKSNELGEKESFPTCAILLFGLPRAFKDFVLPSLEKNVIGPNARYGCDYFVHYYQQDSEESGRSGNGGVIRSEDIFLLKDSVTKVHQAYNQKKDSTNVSFPNVAFVSDTNETFWKARGKEIQHYRTAKNEDGQYAFFPYAERTYEYPRTLDNIVKQWHSINSVWEAMENYSIGANTNRNNSDLKRFQYRRVAAMRNDVIFLTPIDIYNIPVAVKNASATVSQRSKSDFSTNAAAVIPNFAKWPVNDRLIYGPYSAVKIWASQRFARIEDYSKDTSAIPGMVMHSETFLNASILQTIKETQVDANQSLEVFEDEWMCFLRVRADGAIWIEDCDATKSNYGGGYPGGMPIYLKLLNEFLPNKGRGCKKRRLKDKVRKIVELACPKQELQKKQGHAKNSSIRISSKYH